jgi:integrase
MRKLKSSFVLKKYSKEESLVELYLNFGYKEYNAIKDKHYYKPLRYYTGIKVGNGEWDKVKKIPYDSKKLNELMNLDQTAHDIFNYLSKQEINITPDLLREELDKAIKGKTEVKAVFNIREYIQKVMLVRNESQRSPVTLRNFNKLANKIEEFESEFGITFTIDNLNEELYLKFVNFHRAKFNRINTVWDLCKGLKTVLSEIRRKYKIEVFNPTIELAKGDKISARTEDKVYFNFSQIQKIIDYEPQNERLRNTKLILLTLVFSGCRYSDVFKILPEFTCDENEIQFRYARFIDQKTNKDIIVPILEPLEQAYRENGGEPPYRISDVKFNKYVKELCKLADLTDEVTLSYTDANGKKQYEVKQFYQFVTSHIGRRSFITNLINFIPITILTKITGHSIKDKSIIFSYNKISLLDNAVLFVKELKRVTEMNSEEFSIQLVPNMQLH